MTGKATVPASPAGRDFGVDQGAKNAHSRSYVSLFATQKYPKRYLGLPRRFRLNLTLGFNLYCKILMGM